MTVTKTAVVEPGTSPTWSVSATGFVTQSGTISNISASELLDIYLLGDTITKDGAVKQIEATTNATWILLTDGTLWGCGNNTYGQQGRGSSGSGTEVKTFTQRLTDVAKVKAAYNGYVTWALKTDGTLWGCGSNDEGQQGSGTSGSGQKVISFTQRLTGVKDIVSTMGTTWALKTDGTLWGCGYNAWGQQSSNNTTTITTFTQRLTDVKNVFATYTTTWALKTDGTLWGCGNNSYGQQGSGDTTNVTTFTQRLTDVAQLSASTDTTWALKTDGTLWGCGKNNYGQQGSGDTTDVTTFTQRLTDVSDMFVFEGNSDSTWALKTDGTLLGCGDNSQGQQGSGDTTNVKTFTQRLTDVSAGDNACFSTWALKTDGTVWGCGYNYFAQQGSGDTTNVKTFTKRNPTTTGYNSATLTINPTPSDATVTIDQVATKTADIRKGLTATWSVSKTGYTTQTGTTDHLYADTTLNITLESA